MRTEVFRKLFPLWAGRDLAVGPMVAADHCAALLGRSIADVCHSGALLAEGLLKAQKLYGSDFVIVFSDVLVEAEALGVQVAFSKNRNPHAVREPDISAVQECDISTAGRVPQLFEAARICKDALGAEFPVFYSLKDPFSLAALVHGPERFFTALIDDPKSAGSLLQITFATQKRLVQAAIKESYIPLVGAPFVSGSVIGPVWFEQFALPPLSSLLDHINKLGSLCCMHICGEIHPLADLLPRLKLDLLSFEEWYAPLWDKLPGTIPMGYVPTQLFRGDDVKAVKAATRDCLDTLPRPAVLSSACDLPADANFKLVQAMMNAAARFER